MRQGLIADVGDVDIHPTNVERTFQNITEMARGIIERGALTTLVLSAVAVCCGFFVGVFVYTMFISDSRLMRGTPVLAQLLVVLLRARPRSVWNCRGSRQR